MKSNYLGIAILLLCACDGGEPQDQPNAVKPDTSADTPAKQSDAASVTDAKAGAPALPAIESPCDTFDTEFVGETLGWSDLSEGQFNQMNDGRVQSCSFNRSGSVGGSFTVTITKGDARTVERKYIERAFASDLGNTDERITFAEVTPKIGDQTIFSEGKRGPSNIYQLRWRVGNQLDYLMALRSAAAIEPAEAQTQLRELAAKL